MKLKTHLRLLRAIMPRTHVVLPVSLVEKLINAGYSAYGPALGGDEAAVKACNAAAHAAERILARKRL